MRGSIRLFKVFGISINIHVTFLLILALFFWGGLKSAVLIIGVFTLVTLHELCHSLVAKRFGVQVTDITLLPIGGVASMARMPEKPLQEFLIALAGPLFNLAVIVALYLPMQAIFGRGFLRYPLSIETWPLTAVYIYKINFFLAVFNLIPAFPMDGGRLLRSVLAQKLGFYRATKIAVSLGHLFALVFAFFGIVVRFNILWIAIAFFIYIAASSEEAQVDIKETLKKVRVRDILSRDFLKLTSDMTLKKVLETMFHSRQEDFPVVDGGRMTGFVTRQDIMNSIHQFGMEKSVSDIMRKDFPALSETDKLGAVQELMHDKGMTALPVMKDGQVIGIVTFEDIGRAYTILARRF
ncbi:MAG: site-2 protease family protein [Candidatus Omnitrophica bacterium]|nr:site-2 protease family protein [Candidatus Omnitrophota bacterium]